MYFFVFVAAAAALYFAGTAFRQPRLGTIAAAIAWLAYAVYEYFVANGTLCDANCNIRVDLLLIWPLVWIASLFGIYAPGQWPRAAKVAAGLGVALFASMAAISLYIFLVEEPAAQRAAQENAVVLKARAGRSVRLLPHRQAAPLRLSDRPYRRGRNGRRRKAAHLQKIG